MIDYPFTAEEMQAAYDEWGCNCGPSALAFALQVKLDQVRGVIPGFDEKRYTSPTMMRAALKTLKTKYMAIHTGGGPKNMFAPCISLVRVQWTGPWTKEGANPKWAYRQTHWIATFSRREEGTPIAGRRVTKVGIFVFDCNGGIRAFKSWEKEIVPTLTALYPRSDGGWFPVNIWRIG